MEERSEKWLISYELMSKEKGIQYGRAWRWMKLNLDWRRELRKKKRDGAMEEKRRGVAIDWTFFPTPMVGLWRGIIINHLNLKHCCVRRN